MSLKSGDPSGTAHAARKQPVVRVAGVEPALLSELDFESSASTNSTTPAQVQRGVIYKAKARVSTDVMPGRSPLHSHQESATRRRSGHPIL